MLTEPAPSRDLVAVIEAGDRACAAGDRGGLIDATHRAAGRLAPSLEPELAQIEQLVDRDFPEACRRWSTVSRCVRDWVAASFVHR